MENPSQEGTIAFDVPSVKTPCFTYYKVFGNLSNGKPPVVVLHGGPGSGHEYCLAFRKIWSQYGFPVMFYDQIGCASSTHLQQKAGDTQFWQPDLFLSELENVINHFHLNRNDRTGYHLLDHSWGGILTAHFASRQPLGLRRLILVGASADGQLFFEGLWDLTKQLPSESQQAIRDAVQHADFSTPAYKDAYAKFVRMFLCRADPWPPEELAMNFKHQATDPTVRQTLWDKTCIFSVMLTFRRYRSGPSPWVYDGTLGKLSSIPLLSQISVPTLVINGEFDTTQDGPTTPFFNHIPRVRWVTLAGASHMPHLDSTAMQQKILKLVGDFCEQIELSEKYECRV